MNEKLKQAQSHLKGTDVARMQYEFHKHFRDVYPGSVFIDSFTAVGPMHSFLGFLIENGYIELKEQNND